MGTRFMSVGKGKDRKAFPITKPKGTSKTRFNKKSTMTKSRFKVPTLPNDPPKFDTKEIKVWKYENASPDLQEKILENYRNKFSGQDNLFAQDEGILFDNDEKKDAQDIGLKNAMPETFDVGGNRGDDFIQFELEIENKKKFAEYLGLSDSVLKKVSLGFDNPTGSFGSDNTRLEFTDSLGGVIDLSGDTGALDDHYSEDEDVDEDERMFNKEDVPTLPEFVTILHAHDRFADLMDDSLSNLNRAFEFQFSEEFIVEEIKANEFVFDDDGNIA